MPSGADILPTPETIREQAHRWRVLMASGDPTPSDRAAFRAWLAADDRHRAAYDRAERLWRGLGAVDGLADMEPLDRPLFGERLVMGLRAAAGAVRRPAVQLAGAGGVAAALLVAVLLGPQLSTLLHTPDHVTQVAEIRDVTLPDGSQVTLGARSAMDVAFGPDERGVALTRGEAFFDVVHDPARPFVVRVDDTRVRVLGTRFEVHRGPERVRVSVAEGSVEVTHIQTRPAAVDPAPTPQRRVLSAGQQIVARPSAPLSDVRTVSPAHPGAWRSGRLVYVGAPLSEVIADANRYYDATIALASDDLGALTITAGFRTDQIDDMIDSLVAALPITADRRPSGDIVINPAPEAG